VPIENQIKNIKHKSSKNVPENAEIGVEIPKISKED
jgi:hypothetical protein